MPFVLLETLLPEVAEAETRSLFVLEQGAVKRTYVFREAYCDEAGCDCRRVFIHVFSDEPGVAQPRATLTWGWESSAFYRAWASFPLDADDLRELHGPALARLAPQSEEAEAILGQFKTLLSSPGYASRIQRHYTIFRQVLEARAPYDAEAAPAPSDEPPAPLNRAERRRLAAAERRSGKSR